MRCIAAGRHHQQAPGRAGSHPPDSRHSRAAATGRRTTYCHTAAGHTLADGVLTPMPAYGSRWTSSYLRVSAFQHCSKRLHAAAPLSDDVARTEHMGQLDHPGKLKTLGEPASVTHGISVRRSTQQRTQARPRRIARQLRLQTSQRLPALGTPASGRRQVTQLSSGRSSGGPRGECRTFHRRAVRPQKNRRMRQQTSVLAAQTRVVTTRSRDHLLGRTKLRGRRPVPAQEQRRPCQSSHP